MTLVLGGTGKTGRRVVLEGRNAKLADGAQRALGREPRDLGDYARRTAATGIWDGGR